MRLRYLYLSNYAGIYNGLGLNEIEIDFKKCRHKICLIKGDNGSGKSTIMKALKPLPDGNECFIVGREARKVIEYSVSDREYYRIEFIHTINQRGERASTRAYVFRFSPAGMEDLNRSGLLTSAKETIYDIFNLDPCYLSLIQLSSNKRGMADMKPAERKRFVNSILNNVDAYNDIYKSINKKSIIYKGLISNLESRLSTIGDINKVELELKAISKSIEEMEQILSDEKSLKAQAEGVIMSLDSDGSLMKVFDQYNTDLHNSQTQLIELNKEYDAYKSEGFGDSNTDYVDFFSKALSVAKFRKDDLTKKIEKLLSDREKEAMEINDKVNKLSEISGEESLSQYKSMKKEYVIRLEQIKAEIYNSTGIDVAVDKLPFTKESLVHAIEVLHNIRCRLSEPDFSDIDFLTHCMYEFTCERDGEISSKSMIIASKRKLDTLNDKLTELKSLKREMESLNGFQDILSKKPSGCVDDNCPFIAGAAKQKVRYDELTKICSDSQFRNLILEIESAQNYYDKYCKIEEGFRDLILIKAEINSIMPILSIISNPKVKESLRFVLDFKYNTSVIQTVNNFIAIADELYSRIDIANNLEEYNALITQINICDTHIAKMSANEELINLLSADIDKLKENLTETLKETDLTRIEIKQVNDDIITYTDGLDKAKKFNEIKESKESLGTKCANLVNSINQMQAQQSKLITSRKTINDCEMHIMEIENKIAPLRKAKTSMETSLNLAASFITELKQNKEMLNKLDIIKYYTSPTTGIQLVFASIYLSKILNKANEMLATLFGGIFLILPFVITEDEFRIPVAVNGGLNHDDITSMSSAQIALISMIISVSMLSQISTSMNIIVGDEIDASLDPENRRRFFDILLGLMDLIRSEQSILISHNSEYTQNECDVIWLRNRENITEAGNVIWAFE